MQDGALGKTRTPDQELRRLLLYPPELRAQRGRIGIEEKWKSQDAESARAVPAPSRSVLFWKHTSFLFTLSASKRPIVPPKRKDTYHTSFLYTISTLMILRNQSDLPSIFSQKKAKWRVEMKLSHVQTERERTANAFSAWQQGGTL